MYYFFDTNEKAFVEIGARCKDIKIKEFSDFSLFFFKNVDTYFILEKETGTVLGSGDTIDKAKRNVINILDEQAEVFGGSMELSDILYRLMEAFKSRYELKDSDCMVIDAEVIVQEDDISAMAEDIFN